MTTAAGQAPARPAAVTRPTDGSCSRPVDGDYCRETENVRYFREGHRCPIHTYAALNGLPECQPGPGIPAYRTKDTSS